MCFLFFLLMSYLFFPLLAQFFHVTISSGVFFCVCFIWIACAHLFVRAHSILSREEWIHDRESGKNVFIFINNRILVTEMWKFCTDDVYVYMFIHLMNTLCIHRDLKKKVDEMEKEIASWENVLNICARMKTTNLALDTCEIDGVVFCVSEEWVGKFTFFSFCWWHCHSWFGVIPFAFWQRSFFISLTPLSLWRWWVRLVCVFLCDDCQLLFFQW